MLRLFSNAKYDFIGVRAYAYGVTALILIPGLIFLLLKGLNYSIEFTGGTLLQIQSSKPVDVAHLREGLDREGIRGAEIQNFGAENEYVIRARVAKPGSDANDTQATARAVSHALDNVLGAGTYTIARTEAVGPKVGGELRQKAFLAIFLSFFAVLAYLAYRFEWRFGLAAIVATAHDILATIVFVAALRLEMSLTVVAAVLSMVGYSLNDTIIIFDRVRENLRKQRKESLRDVLNRSINETLPRSVMTHVTVFAATLSLLIFAGEVIRPFSWIMAFGVFTGTFSSIYVAGPILLWIEHKYPRGTSTENKGAARAIAEGKRRERPTPVGTR